MKKVRLFFKRDFAGGPQNQKMTMPDDMSSQLVSIDKVQNRDHLDGKWSTGPGQRFFSFFAPGDIFGLFKNCLLISYKQMPNSGWPTPKKILNKEYFHK